MSTKKPQPGSDIFSPWYTEKFVKDKLKDKQNELVRLEKIKEIDNIKDWNDRAQRRFERLWDRLSDDTKRSYKSSARHFGMYLGLKRDDSKTSNIVARLIVLSYMEASTLVEEYMMWMEQEEELSPNTINTRLAALRWFVDAARRVGWVEWKLDVKNVKAGLVTDTSGPNAAEFRRILRVVNTAEGESSTRNKFLVYMLSFMGVRISSAISLNMENIDFEQRKFKVKWKNKGDGASRYVWRPVGDETFDALEDWLKVRGRHDGPVISSLEKKNKGVGRLSIRQAQRIIGDIGVEAATRKKLSPHAFRHFHATDALESENDTRRVMKSTGHSSERTLLGHYDDSDDTAAREVSEAMERRWLLNLETLEDSDEKEIADRYTDDRSRSENLSDNLDDLGIVSSTKAAAESSDYRRTSTGMSGVNRLLGGNEGNDGIVDGSIILIGGFPGIGKSTLIRQVCYNICETNPGKRILYASGEESTGQIGESLERLGCVHDNLLLMSEKSVDTICSTAEKIDASILVIDSISTVAVNSCEKHPGSISQVKALGHYFLDWCKGVGDKTGSGITVVIISHVDKKGNIAGPKALEHHVDAVFTFTSPSKRSNMRSLGCDGKNRFGDASQEMVFKMTNKGLVEITQLDEDEKEKEEEYYNLNENGTVYKNDYSRFSDIDDD